MAVDELEDAGNERIGPESPDAGPLRVTGLSSDGAGVGRLPDGRVVFVDGGVPGDLVELADLRPKKKMARARVGRVLEASPDRVTPRCAHFESCGGCRWQHVRYETQLEAKRDRVRDALTRIGGFRLEREIEIVPSPEPYGYRARARLAETEHGLGYRRSGSHDVQIIEECPVLLPAAEEAAVALSRSIAATPTGGGSSPQAVAKRSRGRVAEWIVSAGSSGPAVVARASHRSRGASGRSITLDVLGESLSAASDSFVQGNALLWPALAEIVREACTLPQSGKPPEHFVELYAGIGFLTLPLAREGLSGVAIESDRSAFADLRRNLSAAGLAKRVETIRDRAEARTDLVERLARADVLLADPPRVGLAESVREAIVASAPARIVYVSCDPATLARDLADFARAGYSLASVHALDLFPQTPHVEAVARLERRVDGSLAPSTRAR